MLGADKTSISLLQRNSCTFPNHFGLATFEPLQNRCCPGPSIAGSEPPPPSPKRVTRFYSDASPRTAPSRRPPVEISTLWTSIFLTSRHSVPRIGCLILLVIVFLIS